MDGRLKKLQAELSYSRMSNFFPACISMSLFLSTGLALGNCHFIAPYVASCLEGSQIINADIVPSNKLRVPYSHSWVERDGIMVDAPNRLIASTEEFEKRVSVQNKHTMNTVEEFWDFMRYDGPSIITKNTVRKSHDEILYYLSYLMVVYKGILDCNTSQNIKYSFLYELSRSIDLSILDELVKEESPTKLKKFGREAFPGSFLFSGKKVSEKDLFAFDKVRGL